MSQVPSIDGTEAMSAPAAKAVDIRRRDRSRAARTLTLTGLNHALHDGYTDLIYVLLPIWQTEFALSYGLLALLRGLYAGAMAGLQIPVGRLAERIDGKTILVLGTALAALGYVLAGLSGGVDRTGFGAGAVRRRVEHPASDRVGCRVAGLWQRGTGTARHL